MCAAASRHLWCVQVQCLYLVALALRALERGPDRNRQLDRGLFNDDLLFDHLHLLGPHDNRPCLAVIPGRPEREIPGVACTAFWRRCVEALHVDPPYFSATDALKVDALQFVCLCPHDSILW